MRYPSNRLEQYVNKLHDEGYDVTISGIEQLSGERRVFSLSSVDHAAERDIDTHEAESGADGTRVFFEAVPEHLTVREHLEQYKPVVIAAVSENTRYRTPVAIPTVNAAISATRCTQCSPYSTIWSLSAIFGCAEFRKASSPRGV